MSDFNWYVYHGDCLDILKRAPDAYFDSMVTDPPAGVSFMGREWDSDKGGREQWVAWMTSVMKEALRVLKPGAHTLVWALPRTSHWTATALEEAGFSVRDVITAHFGSGFPKSQDVRKAAIKAGVACGCRTDEVECSYGTTNLQGVSQASSPTGAGSSGSLLQRPLRRPGEARSVESQSLCGMQSGLGSDECDSGSAESHMLSGMCCHADAFNPTTSSEAGPDLSSVRSALSSEKPSRAGSRPILQSDMCGASPSESAGFQRQDAAHGINGESRVDGAELCLVSEQDARCEESRLEGRRDLQEEQRKLSGAEVCSVSSGVSTDVPEGRLRDGTPVDHGAMDRSVPKSDGSCSSYRPQPSQQLTEEPRTLADQSGAQGGGSWPVCNRCRKPIVPEGIGSALKPASEHWILARKPLSESSIARNVLKHGTGALNIDACRVHRDADDVPGWHKTGADGSAGYRVEVCSYCLNDDPEGCKFCGGTGFIQKGTFAIRAMSPEEVQARCGDKGRWPTNLLLSHAPDCRLLGEKRVKAAGGNVSGEEPSGKTTGVYGEFGERAPFQAHGNGDGTETVEAWDCVPGCPVAELDRQSGIRKAGHHPTKRSGVGMWSGEGGGLNGPSGPERHLDSGGASRFYPTFHYFPKPSRSERERGLEELPERTLNRVNPGGIENDPRWAPVQVKNSHPTVKGVKLMAWLCRLITPPGGLVLDPFCGSGSTGVACMQEGFRFVGIEQDESYVEIAQHRIAAAEEEIKL